MQASLASCRPAVPPFVGPAGAGRRRLPPPAAAAVRSEDVAPAPSRRAALALLPTSAALLAVAWAAPLPAAAAAKVQRDTGDWSSPGLGAPVDPSQPKFFKTPSGVRVQVLAEGSGPEAAAGDAVLVDFVLRRSNGYFIYGTVDGVSFQPKDVPVGPMRLQLGDGSTVAGLEEALLGSRAGTKLRVLVPPELGYQSNPGAAPQMPTFATQRQLENHKSEPLLFEVQLLRVGGQK